MNPKTVQLVCVASFVAKNGKEDELAKALAGLMPLTRREEGCIRYELNRNLENPRRFTMVEKFNDDAAFEVHKNAAYVKEVVGNLIPGLVEESRVELYREITP